MNKKISSILFCFFAIFFVAMGVIYFSSFTQKTQAQFAECPTPCVWPQVCITVGQDPNGDPIRECRLTTGCTECEPSLFCSNGCPGSKTCVGNICEERCNALLCQTWDGTQCTNDCEDPCSPCNGAFGCVPITCPAGQTCSAGVCVAGCDNEHPCPAGQTCVNGQCGANECDAQTPCPAGSTCVNGFCEPDITPGGCTTNEECAVTRCSGDAHVAHCPGKCNINENGVGVCNDGNCEVESCEVEPNCVLGCVGSDVGSTCDHGSCAGATCTVTTTTEKTQECPKSQKCITHSCTANDQCETQAGCTPGGATPGCGGIEYSTCSCCGNGDTPCNNGICGNACCAGGGCTSNSDCPTGQTCKGGTCKGGGSGGGGNEGDTCGGTDDADCKTGLECKDGKCEKKNPCGDGECKNGETCSSCEDDCGTCPVCGDGNCEGTKGETCSTCSGDCGPCPSHHNICNSSTHTCEEASGSGDNECGSSGGACYFKCDIASAKCSAVDGTGTDECTSSGGDCQSSCDESTFVCNFSAGSGGIICQDSSNCAPTPTKCDMTDPSNPTCTTTGTGTSCVTKDDCTTPTKHKECDTTLNTCKEVDGAGEDNCSTVDGKCYTACNTDLQTCDVFDGELGNSCSANADCVTPSKCNTTTSQCDAAGTGELCVATIDCSCGNLTCDTANGETCESCPGDCGPCDTHNECDAVTNMCKVVTGPGTNQCTSVGDLCTHTECNASTDICETIIGSGTDECANVGSLCNPVTHNVCNTTTHTCNTIDGAGSSDCTIGESCGLACNADVPPSQTCEVTVGATSNTCELNSTDCVDFSYCVGSTCSSIATSGIVCTGDGDCPVGRCNGAACDGTQTSGTPCWSANDCKVYHNECTSGTCTRVEGTGTDQCSLAGTSCHFTCNLGNHTCGVSSGTGTNQCNTFGGECHSICNTGNNTCGGTGGAGTDQCTTIGGGCYAVCDSTLQTCTNIASGTGTNQCEDQSDCVPLSRCTLDAQQCIPSGTGEICSYGNPTTCVATTCGDGTCDPDISETCVTCATDCGACVNNPPTVTNPTATNGNPCTGEAASYVTFSWVYTDPDEVPTPQAEYKLQISKDSDFVNDIAVDISSSGTTTSQMIRVKQTDPGFNGGFLQYGQTYYWRVMVRDSSPVGKWSDWKVADTTYTKTGHPAPIVQFSYDKINPMVEDPVTFTNNSICFDNNGTDTCGVGTLYYGDNTTVSKNNLVTSVHTYTYSGRFNAHLNVCEKSGVCCDSLNSTITVSSNGDLPNWKEVSPF